MKILTQSKRMILDVNEVMIKKDYDNEEYPWGILDLKDDRFLAHYKDEQKCVDVFRLIYNGFLCGKNIVVMPDK